MSLRTAARLSLLLACAGACGDKETDDGCIVGAVDICDGLDNDCDGEVDEDAAYVDYFADADGDGYGAGGATSACEPPADLVENDADCDDGDAAVSPVGAEVCDDIDNDCDGAIDDADSSVTGLLVWYLDYDGDGFGGDVAFQLCQEPTQGYTDGAGDCDDLDSAVNPDAPEICDGLDNDCDDLIDDDDPDVGDPVTWYRDADADGYGDADTSIVTCGEVAGYVTDASDCDDARGAVNPGEDESCNDGLDNDCSGGAPECPPLEGSYSRTVADATVTGTSTTFGHYIDSADVTGDGIDDLVVSDPNGGTSYTGAIHAFSELKPGDAESYSGARSTILGQSTGTYLGYHAAVPGDLTGDGYADIVAMDGDSVTWFFDGPLASGSTVLPHATVSGITDASTSGGFATLIGGGDFNGDGADDVVLGDPRQSTYTEAYAGAAWLLAGPLSAYSDVGLTSVYDVVVYGESGNDQLGRAVSSGDSDGDGMDELVVSALGSSDYGYSSGGAVFLFEGGGSGGGAVAASAADMVFYGTSDSSNFGFAIEMGGDLDGDGYADLAVSAPDDSTFGSGTGSVFIFTGSFSGGSLGAYFGADAITYGRGDGYYGYSIDVASGFDADAVDDLLVGEIGNANAGYSNGGAMHVHYGPLAGSSRSPDVIVTGTASSQYYGHRVAALGDLDDDGYNEIGSGGYFDYVVDVFFGGEGM